MHRWTMLLFVTAVFMMASSVRASIEITLQEDGGATAELTSVTDFSAAGVSFTGATPDYNVSFQGTSGNGATASDVSITGTVTQTGTGTHSLVFAVSQTNFTLPTSASLSLKSAIGGTFAISSSGDSISETSYANISNGILDKTGAASGGSPTFTSPGGIANPFSESSAIVPFSHSSSMYSMTMYTTLSMAAGGTMDFAGSAVTTAAVPEPASLGLLSVGGLLALRRRRRPVPVCSN